jgi:Xaa-Pro aminopeptidase
MTGGRNAIQYADSGTSTDLFHAIPATIVDPFLYVETDARKVALISSLDRGTVQAANPSVEVVDPDAYGRRDLMKEGMGRQQSSFEVVRRALADLGVREAVVPWDFPLALADVLRADGVELRPDAQHFADRRRMKTEPQLAGIRRAQRAADAAMAVARDLIHACADGLTAEAVRAAMQAAAREHGCELADDVIVGPGAQGAAGHDIGTGPIEPGVGVIVDIWPQDPASRCWSDMTRTFWAGGGEPDAELREFWSLTRDALERVTAAVRPGAHGRDLNALASEVYEAAGKPTARTAPGTEGFFHGLGHGVGLDIHEAPGLGMAGDELVTGDVITLEPGCYRQGYGGVRLEDIVLVTPGGCEVLTDFPYEL